MILFEIEVFLFYAKCGHLEDIFLSFFCIFFEGQPTFLYFIIIWEGFHWDVGVLVDRLL